MKSIKGYFLIAGIFLGVLGIFFLSGNPRWLIGLPLQAAALWLIIKSFPARFATLPEFVKPTGRSVSKSKARGKKRKTPAPVSGHWIFFGSTLALVAAAAILMHSNVLYPGLGLLVLALGVLALNRKKIFLNPADPSRVS